MAVQDPQDLHDPPDPQDPSRCRVILHRPLHDGCARLSPLNMAYPQARQAVVFLWLPTTDTVYINNY